MPRTPAVVALLAVALLAVGVLGCPKTPSTGATVTGPWEIRDGAVGPFTLGAALPAELLDGAEQAYFARYIADGVPQEGFTLDGVDVAIAGGPFAAWDKRADSGDPPLDELRGPAVDKARRGARIVAVLVQGDGPRTAAGAGVGSTLAELEAAHGAAKLRPLPPTLGGDRCSVRLDALPGAGFVFGSCDAAREGAQVLRVDLWRD
jgi:hypothetical protein